MAVVMQVPREPQHPKVDPNPERVLKQDSIIQLRVLLFRAADVSFYRVTLGIRRDKRIGEHDQQVMQVGVSPGDGRVARSIGKQMMIEVVGWNPHHGRITIEDRQNVAKAAIETLDGKRWLMVVIVRYNTTSNRQVTGNGAEEKHGFRPAILNCNQRDCHADPNKRTDVGFFSQIHVSFGAKKNCETSSSSSMRVGAAAP